MRLRSLSQRQRPRERPVLPAPHDLPAPPLLKRQRASRGPRGSGTALTALRGLRSSTVATAVVLLVQGPALLALALLVPHGLGWLALLPAAGLSHALLVAAASPFSFQPRGRIHLYLGIWPGLVWWTACATFFLLAPVVLLVSWLLQLPIAPGLAAAGAFGALVGVRGVWRSPQVCNVPLRFPELPPALDGYRIAQISDIHCGPFAPEERVLDWVQRVNALRPDLIVVTGDLIVSGASHIGAVARALSELRAPDGVFVVMGNHDYFGAGEILARALQDAGLRLLLNESEPVRRGDATLLVAGVDDTWTGRSDPERALLRREPGAFPILLAHDPDLFPHAARLGVPLMLSGHTHGGQIGVPFWSRRFNLARLIAHYTSGLYQMGSSFLYVNRGIGTTGPPLRIGARAEISVFTLHRTPQP